MGTPTYNWKECVANIIDKRCLLLNIIDKRHPGLCDSISSELKALNDEAMAKAFEDVVVKGDGSIVNPTGLIPNEE